MQIRERVSFWKTVLAPAWRWTVLIPFTIVTAATWARDEFLPAKGQERYTFLNVLPNWEWEWWALIGLGVAMLIVLESAFRQDRKLKQELAYKEGPSALPLTVTVVESASVIGRKYRFRVCNSTDNPVTDVYGKYRGYRKINQPFYRFWTSLPFDGTNLPWDDP